MYDELVNRLRMRANLFKKINQMENCIMDEAADAIEELSKRVPKRPHGRLIDADAIRADIDEKRPGRSYEDAWALTIMDAAPTVLEAEEV